MASRYDPPHLRKHTGQDQKDKDANQDHGDDQNINLEPRKLADLKLSGDNSGVSYTLAEIRAHFGSTRVTSTLHESAERPNELAYIVLFRDANPRWKSDHVIFAHTNIDILPGYNHFKHERDAPANDSAKESPQTATTSLETECDAQAIAQPSVPPIDGVNTDRPQAMPDCNAIPIFIEIDRRQTYSQSFEFHGFFDIANVHFLKPNSQELVRMLQQKWNSGQRSQGSPWAKEKQRDSSAWRESMRQEWAVLQMTPVPKLLWPAEPKIEAVLDE